jgi:hypothetical protein
MQHQSVVVHQSNESMFAALPNANLFRHTTSPDQSLASTSETRAHPQRCDAQPTNAGRSNPHHECRHLTRLVGTEQPHQASTDHSVWRHPAALDVGL